MRSASDFMFIIEGEDMKAVPRRSFREGVGGRRLEDALQHLIEREPNLLPGSSMAPTGSEPTGFVVLGTEVPVADGRADVVLVDEHAVLAVVETKLIENPDSRRSVIGQALEYAANANNAWKEVERNLSQGRLRLIIAADQLHPSVRAVIEFLNNETRNLDIYGLDVIPS